MISSRSPPDAMLEESSPGFSNSACSVEESAGAAVKVALTGRLFGAKRFVRARPACEFEVKRDCFVPVAKLRREMRVALPPVIEGLLVFEGGHWKLAYADEPLTSTRITKL